ncbi:MAG: alpha-E domain-containing protein, partial [Lachnospiraceae bacterium]|nr:alpha-E domain-containing protein [Lachnospiraceae bacterium]
MDELGRLDGCCKQLEIPNIYTSGEDFVARYCFDPEDPNSIYSNLTRAYDNCIVLREEIGSDTISYIQLAMYEMNKARISPSPLIELQRVLDDILAFWGIVDDEIDSENVRNIIKVGKRVERLDLYARLRMSREEMKREVDRLSGRIWRTCLKYRQSYLDDLSRLVEEPRIDYLAIVQKTEMLLEGQE